MMNAVSAVKKILFFVVLATYSMLSGLEPGDLKGVYSYIKPEYHHLIPTALIRENNFLESIYLAGHNKCATANLVRALYHRVPGNFKISDADWKQPAYYFDEKTIGSIVGYIEKMAGDKEPVEKDAFVNGLKIIVMGNYDQVKLKSSKDIYGNESAKNEATQDLEKNKKECQPITDFIQLIKNLLKTAEIADNDIDTEEKVEAIKKKIIETQIIRREEDDKKTRTNLERLKKEWSEITKTIEPVEKKELKELNEKKEKTKKALEQVQVGIGQSQQKFEKLIENTQKNIDEKWKKVKDLNIKQLRETKKKLSDKINDYEESKKLDYNISSIASIIVGSLEECGYFDKEKAIFPSDVTQKILQVFAFEKMEKKDQLGGYFESVVKSLGYSIIVKNAKIPEGCFVGCFDWIKKLTSSKKESFLEKRKRQRVYGNPTGRYTYEDFKSFSEKIKNNFANASEEELLYALTFEFFYNGALPKKVTYKSGVLYLEKFGFPDCMETTLRNLFNICILAKDNPFDLKKCTEVLQKFYGETSVQSRLSDLVQHNDWTKVVSNLPFIAYHRILDVKQGKQENLTTDVNDNTLCRVIYGFEITVDMNAKSITILDDKNSFHEITINNQKFIHVDQAKIKDGTYKLFEVMPTLKNAIIMFDYHLKLGLFKEDVKKEQKIEKENEDAIATVFFEPNFCKKFLDGLCEKLGWTVGTSKTTSEIDSYNVSVFINVTKSNAAFSINTQPFHGWVKQESTDKRADFWNVIAETMFECGIKNKNSDLVSFKIVDMDEILETFKADKVVKHYRFFMQQLGDENNALDVVKKFLKVNDGDIDSFIKQSLMRLIEIFPVNDELLYQKALVYAIDEENKSGELAIKICNEAAKAADTGIKSTNSGLRGSALGLFEELVETGCENAFDKATNVAGIGFEDKDAGIRESALGLYGKLVEKGKAIDKAIIAAGIGIEDDSGVKHSAFDLFGKLVEKKKAIGEATNAAIVQLNDNALWVKSSALNLFGKLVEKGEAINEATKAAGIGFEDNNWEIRELALNLYGKLVEKGEVINEATKAAGIGLKDRNWVIRESALGLYGKLVEKGEAINEATKAAGIGIGDNHSDTRSLALALYEKLFKNEKAFDEATNVAREAFLSMSSDVRISALDLFRKLVEKGNAIEDAIKAAGIGLKDRNSDVRTSALDLFRELVEKGNAIEDAIKAAGFGIVDQNLYGDYLSVRNSALALYEKLFEVEGAKKQAVKAANKLIESNKNNNDTNIQNTLKDLQEAIENAQRKK